VNPAGQLPRPGAANNLRRITHILEAPRTMLAIDENRVLRRPIESARGFGGQPVVSYTPIGFQP
jgi:hypothetical protein